MPGFWIYAIAVAASLVPPLPQAGGERRMGFVCVFWPHDATGAPRAKKRFDVSWVFPDGKMTGHAASTIEVLEAPKQIGRGARVVDFRRDGEGINLLLSGDAGRFVLSLAPRPGHGGEYDAGAGAPEKAKVEYFGGCHTLDADEKLIASLRSGSRD